MVAFIFLLPFVLRTAYLAYLNRWGDAEGQSAWTTPDKIGFVLLGI